MSNDFLCALSTSFSDLMCPEAEAAMLVDRVVDETLEWLAGDGDGLSLVLEALSIARASMRRVSDCPQKRMLDNGLSLLVPGLEHGDDQSAWRVLECLRQGARLLRQCCEELPAAA